MNVLTSFYCVVTIGQLFDWLFDCDVIIIKKFAYNVMSDLWQKVIILTDQRAACTLATAPWNLKLNLTPNKQGIPVG